MKKLLTLIALCSILSAFQNMTSEDAKLAKKFKYENTSINMYMLATE